MDSNKTIKKTMSCQAGSIRLKRPNAEIAEIYAFLLARPFAWILLSQIALRADREGKAMIGDYKTLGMSEQNYRTAKAQLEKSGQVEFSPSKNRRGTVAKLMKSSIWEVVLPAMPTPKSNEDEGEISKEGKELLRLLELYPPAKIKNLHAFLVSKREKIKEGGITDRDREDLQALREKEAERTKRSEGEEKRNQKQREEAEAEAARLAQMNQLENEGFAIYEKMNELGRARIDSQAAMDADRGSRRWRAIVSDLALKSRTVEGVDAVLRRVLQQVV